MRKNALRRHWDQGEHTVNGWCAIPSSWSAEVMANAGWQSVTLDLQHGLIDYQAALGMLQAISTTATVPIARVPWREAGIVMKMLDAGAYGIICPMVNNRAQAEEFVSYCRYAPRGQRSFGPTRAMVYAGSGYASEANDEVLALAMIETTEALDNLEAIMTTEGLDGVYVGPADLSLSMGHVPQLDPVAEEVRTEIRRIVDTAKKFNRYAGIHCGATSYAKEMWSWGFDFTTIGSDSRLLAAKASEIVTELGFKSEAPKSGTY